jgi:hypothetical protein
MVHATGANAAVGTGTKDQNVPMRRTCASIQAQSAAAAMGRAMGASAAAETGTQVSDARPHPAFASTHGTSIVGAMVIAMIPDVFAPTDTVGAVANWLTHARFHIL